MSRTELTDVQREAWVVGALLHDQQVDSIESAKALLEALSLTPADFSSPKFSRAFAACEALLRQGRPASVVDVAEVLVAGREADRKPIVDALRDLRAQAVPSRELLVSHARRLRRLALLRGARAFLSEQAQKLDGTGEVGALASDLTAFASTLSMATRGYRSASEDVARIVEAQEEVNLGRRMPLVPTGIEVLDEHILGFRSTLSIIAGAPGVGKTALMSTIVENIAEAFVRREDGSRIGLFALEDGTEAITSRIVARHSGLAWGAIGAVRLNDYQLERFQDGCGVAHRVMDLVEKFEPEVGESVTASQVTAVARDWVLNRKVKIIFLDHLGELEPEAGDTEKHYLRVKAMAKELRALAIRFSVPVVLLHHLNREAQKSQNGRPQLHHLAEAEYLGRMCRLALGLWPGGDEDSLNVSILKQTRGPAGAAMGSKVLVLRRLKEAAMVSNHGGAVVDLAQEGA